MTAPIQHPVSGEELADVLAIAPDTLDERVIDITPGKAYPVIRDGDRVFTIHDDADYPIICAWEACAHLYGAGWTRSAATAARQQGCGRTAISEIADSSEQTAPLQQGDGK